MKPGVPWSVKGIEPDAREAAKIAARRSGMTLGEWLNSKILEGNESIPDTRPEFAAPPRARSYAGQSDVALERTASRLEDIAEHLARLSRRESETAQRAQAPLEDRSSASTEALHKILSRVESNERQTVEAFTAVNDRLSVLGRQFTQAVRPRDNKPEESPGFVALEKAVRNIVEHMESSEKRTRDNFKSLQDRMSALSQKAASAPQDSVARQSPAFTQLETRLSELAKRVERSEASPAQSTLPDLLKSELTELANRIDSVRETAESLASRAQTQAVQTSQHELRAIEQRIVGLIKEAQTSLTGHAATPAEMQRLRSEVERLNARIDDANKAQAHGGDVMALKAAVEQLSTRVAQGPDMRPLADLDRRILDVTQRLEQTQAQTANLPAFNQLESRIADLDHRLSVAMDGRGNATQDDIETRLDDISARMARTEQQMGSLETIERAVNQLFDSLEQQRTWTQEVADGAAQRMAQHVLSQPQNISLAGTPEIQALHEGLTAVRAASENADQRNQETLEAVHETLEQIVTKLAELETAAIGQRVAAAASVMAEPLPEMPAFDQPAFEGPSVWPTSEPQAQVPPAAETVFAPITEAPLAQNPFDATFENPVSNPFEQPAASAAAADAPDDFIAAARRAAQAAVQPKSVLTGLSPGAARMSEETSKKLLGLNMFKVKKKAAANAQSTHTGELKHPPGFKPANGNDARKRKYIIMGIALLAAVSVFTFNMLSQTKKAAPPAQPAAIEQQLAPAEPAAPAASAAPATEQAPADATKAAPPQPKPAEIEGMLMDGTADPVLTGSIAKPAQDNLAALVEGTANPDMPPSTVGTLQLREAASLGNADAQFVIATRYLNGEAGVEQDYAKAAYWYGKAAAGGSAPAQYRLGTLYERGKGVAKDMSAALGWYERSASLGNVKAMHNAAVLAASNEQHTPDFARAFKWFSLGAAHGLKDSQFNLAVLLERGLGTKANAGEAMFWYSIAAKQNDADAAARADKLAKTMTPAELQATEERMRGFTAEVPPASANTVAVTEPSWDAQSAAAG